MLEQAQKKVVMEEAEAKQRHSSCFPSAFSAVLSCMSLPIPCCNITIEAQRNSEKHKETGRTKRAEQQADSARQSHKSAVLVPAFPLVRRQ
jgi:hypothetical protein